MSFIHPDDAPGEVVLAIVLVVIALLALWLIPHPLGVRVQ